MRIRLVIPIAAGCTGLSLLVAPGVQATPVAAAAAAADPGFVLTTTQPGGPGFAPAFVGNGYLAGRQPAEGQGFATVQLPDRALPTQSQVHGFYAKASARHPARPAAVDPDRAAGRAAGVVDPVLRRRQRPLLAELRTRRRLPAEPRRPHRHADDTGHLDLTRRPGGRAYATTSRPTGSTGMRRWSGCAWCRSSAGRSPSPTCWTGRPPNWSPARAPATTGAPSG